MWDLRRDIERGESRQTAVRGTHSRNVSSTSDGMPNVRVIFPVASLARWRTRCGHSGRRAGPLRRLGALPRERVEGSGTPSAANKIESIQAPERRDPRGTAVQELVERALPLRRARSRSHQLLDALRPTTPYRSRQPHRPRSLRRRGTAPRRSPLVRWQRRRGLSRHSPTSPRPPASVVRQALAQALADYSWWGLDHVVARLLLDPDSDVAHRRRARRPLAPRAGPRLVERLKPTTLAHASGDRPAPSATGRPGGRIHPARRSSPRTPTAMCRPKCAHLHRAAPWAPSADTRRPVAAQFSPAQGAHARVSRLRALACARCCSPGLDERCQQMTSTSTVLKTFGTVLTLEAQAGKLPRAYEVDVAIEESGQGSAGEHRVPRSGRRIRSGQDGIIYELALAWPTTRRALGPPRVSPPSSSRAPSTSRVGDETAQPRQRRPPPAPCHPLRSQSRGAGLHRRHLQERLERRHRPGSAHRGAAMSPSWAKALPSRFARDLARSRSLRRLFHSVQVPPTEPEETRDHPPRPSSTRRAWTCPILSSIA